MYLTSYCNFKNQGLTFPHEPAVPPFQPSPFPLYQKRGFRPWGQLAVLSRGAATLHNPGYVEHGLLARGAADHRRDPGLIQHGPRAPLASDDETLAASTGNGPLSLYDEIAGVA